LIGRELNLINVDRKLKKIHAQIMITKLDKIVPGFRRFSRSQFLTEGQLNQIFDHFDDQIRLSRVNLSGVGIVCGFEVSIDRGEVIVNQGLGITTDGDLLHLYTGSGDNKTIDFSGVNYCIDH